MNKEQSADDPPWTGFAKNMLTALFILPRCCNCVAGKTGVPWKHSEQLRQRW